MLIMVCLPCTQWLQSLCQNVKLGLRTEGVATGRSSYSTYVPKLYTTILK